MELKPGDLFALILPRSFLEETNHPVSVPKFPFHSPGNFLHSSFFWANLRRGFLSLSVLKPHTHEHDDDADVKFRRVENGGHRFVRPFLKCKLNGVTVSVGVWLVMVVVVSGVRWESF